MLKKKLGVEETKIQVPLDEWTSKTSLISNQEQVITNLKEAVRNLKHDLKCKDAFIEELQKSISSLTGKK